MDRYRLAKSRRDGKRVAGGKREARGPRSGGVPQEPWQGRKVFIRMLNLSPLQGSCRLHPLTPGGAALARGYSLTAPSGQGKTRFATEIRLGALPGNGKDRVHGACAARLRREGEARPVPKVDDEQRGARPRSPCTFRILAAREHPRRRRSSTMRSGIACVEAPCICPPGACTETYISYLRRH
jgi:hypothetical protein